MKKRNIFLSVALVLVGILVFCSAIDKAAELKEYQKTSCMKLEQEIDAESAEQAVVDFMKNEKKQLVFWSKEQAETCENPMFNRSMKIKEMIFCGELSLLQPECGSTGEREESKECIVDEEASLQLFGNKNATGQMIELAGQEYTVRHTIKGEEGLVIRRAEAGEPLQYVSTRGKQGENREAVQKLTMNYGIAGEEIMLPLFYLCASLILGLIPAVCGVLGVAQLLNIWRDEKQKIKIGWLEKGFAGIIVAILILWICMKLFQPELGLSLYPLSDFDSWSQQIKWIAKQILRTMEMEKPWILATYFTAFRKCLSASALSAICLWSGIRMYIRKINGV